MESHETRPGAGGGGPEDHARPEAVGGCAARVVLITAPVGDAARSLARGLVEARLAACVNVVGEVRSVYRWEGQVQDDAEALLIVKTTAERLAELERWLAESHPYDVPECVALAPARVEPKYLAWLAEECRGGE